MGNHVLSVCVFCFLCATHSPCESHGEINYKSSTEDKSDLQFSKSNVPPNNIESIPLNINILRKRATSNSYLYERNILNKSIYVDEKPRRKRENLYTSVNSDIYNSDSKLYEDKYLKKIFMKYGNGTSMTIDGFKKLLNQLDLMVQVSQDKIDPVFSFKSIAALISHETENLTDSSNISININNKTCFNHDEMILNVLPNLTTTSNSTIDDQIFQKICPALLYTVVAEKCSYKESDHVHLNNSLPSTLSSSVSFTVWLYSITAVAIISFCGILSVLIIPLMQNKFYQPLLQFLIALAVGTLAGDALLHLLPHAMSGVHEHFHDKKHIHNSDSSDHHDDNMWKGFTAMLGVILFFLVEKIIIIVSQCRGDKNSQEKIPKIKVMKEGLQPSSTGDKQCKHKYSSIPYCYDTIAMIEQKYTKEDNPVFRLLSNNQDGNSHQNDHSIILDSDAPIECNHKNSQHKTETNQNMTECPNDINGSNCTEVNKMLTTSEKDETDDSTVEYTVILREHENRHHGHSHAHGHVHAAPKSLSSVAWMVIMGDGLHNFTDGLAIGAAFSNSIAGGCSTAVAVFCHELPHELGDFAMLLKAGMSIRRALFYNLLSSILCALGNGIGVMLGNVEYANSWVFAFASGTFLYIALVDMIPELTNGHERKKGSVAQCILQMSGLTLGVFIMTLIAKYEHNLKNMFHEPL